MSPNIAHKKKSTASHPIELPKMNSVMTNSPSRRFLGGNDSSESSTSAALSQTLLNISEEIPKFNYEKERLKSFDGWPVSFLSPSSMASAGFYFMKREDIVRCAFCGVEVGCWVEGDNPMQDHERWSPSCRFVKKMPVGNVPINSDNVNISSTATEVPKDNGHDTCGIIEFRPSECGVNVNCKEGPLPPLEKLGIHKRKPPSFPHYASVDARLRTYAMWPIALKLKPNTLSEAGFFYTGKGDQTICFHCGGGLKDWEESDDPWVEHARWFSKCNFILLSKGKDFVEDVCGRKHTKGLSRSEETLSKTETESTRLEGQSCSKECKSDKETEKEQEGGKSEHTGLCKICYTEEVGVVFLPCGHLVACVKCAMSLTSCAVCRQDVTATVRVFLS